MNKNISYDFCMAIRPLLYVSRALGLAPYVFVKKTLPGGRILEKPEISSVALIYSMFFFALYLCVFAVSFTFTYTYIYSQMPAADTVSNILLHTVSISSIVSLVLSVTKNRNSIVRITSLIAETDKGILTSATEYYRKAKIGLFVQLLVIFIVIGMFSFYDYVTWYSLRNVMVLCYGHLYVDMLIEWIVVIQFVNMVVLLKDRFSLLNKRLSNLSGIFEIENSKEGFHLPSLGTAWVSVKEMKTQLKGKEILTFNTIHDILFDTVLLVQSTYEVQIFLSLLSSFAGITIYSYYGLCVLYGYISSELTTVSTTSLFLRTIIPSLLHMAKLLCITVPCHSANNNMVHTSNILRKLLLAFHTDPATMSELERFSHHVALRKFKFTVFGFLSLDLSLLVSMMGAVATYLVILMQFKMASNVSPACSKNVTA
jgi:gustatory receptor